MPKYYEYLISSLPMLHFEAQPPFSFESFLIRCAELISQKDMQTLQGVSLLEPSSTENYLIRKWIDFDIALRNELVKVRAVYKKVDPAKYLRSEGYASASIYHIAIAAHRNPSVLGGEMFLDRQRWNFLDELAIGHYFDLDFLIVYALKMGILERWKRIHTADKELLLESTLTAS